MQNDTLCYARGLLFRVAEQLMFYVDDSPNAFDAALDRLDIRICDSRMKRQSM